MSRLSTRREPFFKGEKLLFTTLPLGAAGLVLLALWMRRADDVPQISFPATAALPIPNGFDVYVAAARSVRAANPPVDAVEDGRALLLNNPKQAAMDYSLARRTAWLRGNAPAFALMRQGLRTPSRFPGARAYPSLGPLLHLARAKAIEANTLIMQKRWGAATTACLDTMQMGSEISREGTLLARLLGIAVTAIARSPLVTTQNVPEQLSADEAKLAARRLERILATRPSFKAALQNGKWEQLRQLLSEVEAGNWRSRTWRAIGKTSSAPLTWRDRMARQLVAPRDVVSRIEESFDRVIGEMNRPYRVPRAPAPPLDSISELYVPGPHVGRFSEGREIVTLNTLLLRFALRAYHAENGRFPDSLPQLAPRYLKRIPTDYFASGAPFRYRNDGKDYALWSVGPDQKDDGGVPLIDPNFAKHRQFPGQFPQLLPNSRGDYVAGKNR